MRLYDYLKALESRLIDLIGLWRTKKLQYFLQNIIAVFYSKRLDLLAKIFRTDKGVPHNYVKLYSQIFYKHRKQKLRILELGIGGYRDELAGGNSLRMWAKFFPNSEIIGVDIFPKKFHENKQIKTRIGSQDDYRFLSKLVKEFSSFDIIIDDASHCSTQIIKTFGILFPVLNLGGFYCIEDLHTAYWADNSEGDYLNEMSYLDPVNNSIGFVKRCLDSLYLVDSRLKPEKPAISDGLLTEIHAMRGLVILRKGKPSAEKPPQHRVSTIT